MKVLVGCEWSGVVREAFKKKGHYAISCDLLPTEIPGNHYQGDIMEFLDIYKKDFDLMIVFPPCTYLTVAGNRHFKNNPKRWEKRLVAIKFVHKLLNTDIPKIALENPKGVITSHIRKADQYIQPWQFGHPEPKMTGLWLKNLPLLKPTEIVEPIHLEYNSMRTKSGKSRYGPMWALGKGHGKERGKTYEGIAAAMAEQWG